eukprot:1159286-Pelagomonas_calceolata.AAC.6
MFTSCKLVPRKDQPTTAPRSMRYFKGAPSIEGKHVTRAGRAHETPEKSLAPRHLKWVAMTTQARETALPDLTPETSEL